MSTQTQYEKSFITENEFFTDKTFEEFLLTFQDKYNDMVHTINQKDFGLYTQIETLCGQRRFDRTTVNTTQDVIRKVIDFGALPNAALKQVAHSITVDANTEFIRMYATANNPGVSAIQVAHPMILEIDATNVKITTVDNKTAYTVCTVTVEYIGG